MLVCCLDEAGDLAQLPSLSSKIQPVFVLGGLVIDARQLRLLTDRTLHLKARYFPARRVSQHYLDWVRVEIKGAELRRAVRGENRRSLRHAIGFLDQVVALMEDCGARLVARVWIKPVEGPFRAHAVYTASMQAVCEAFQARLVATDDHGVMIADSRTKPDNARVAHSIFTQKFSRAGDRYDRVVDVPTYGHGENHVGLQLADLVCSALLFPMAASGYCGERLDSVHAHPRLAVLRQRYGQRLRALQFKFGDPPERLSVTVTDRLLGRSSAHLFRSP